MDGGADGSPGAARRVLTVSAEHAGWKLAKFLSTMFPAWSRNAAATCAKTGDVRVNMEVSGANRVLDAGDSISLHVEPPDAPVPIAADVCTLSADEIERLVLDRQRAKAARDFAAADMSAEELRRCGVHLDDRTKTWRAPGGLKGVQPELSAEEITALRLAKKEEKATPGLVQAQGDASSTAAETERRRIRNLKKRQAKARKAAGRLQSESSESAAATSVSTCMSAAGEAGGAAGPMTTEHSPQHLRQSAPPAEIERVVGEKHKDAPV